MDILSQLIFGGTSIVDVPLEVYEKLELNDMFTGLLRSIGSFIYDMASFILNGVEDAFSLLVRFDFSTMTFIEGMQVQIKDIIYSIMLLAFLITLVLNLLQAKSQMKLVYNIAMASLAISCFFGIVTMLQEFKNTGMNQIDIIVQRQENEKMSERIFKMNAWDMVKSVEEGQLYLIDEATNLAYVSLGSTMADDVLGDKIIGNNPISGEPIIMDVNQGIGGIGDERYFMVTADLVAINVSILVILIVYLFGIVKIASLVAELLNLILIGTPVMATSTNSLSRIQMIYTMALQNMLGFLFVYFGMNVYTLIIDANFKDQLTTSWLANITLLFVMGGVLLLGGDAIMKKLGIDGGSGGMMRAGALFWGTSKINRAVSKGFKSIGNFGSSIHDGVDSIGTWAKGTTTESQIPKTEYGSVHFENPEMKENKAQDTSSYADNDTRYESYTDSEQKNNDPPLGTRFKGESSRSGGSSSGSSTFDRDEYNTTDSDRSNQKQNTSKFESYREQNDVQRENDYNIKQSEKRANEFASAGENKKQRPRKVQYKGSEFEYRDGKFYDKSNQYSKSFDKEMPDWYFEDYVSEENTSSRDTVDGRFKTDLDEKIDSRMSGLSENESTGQNDFDMKAFEEKMEKLRQGGNQKHGNDTEKDEDYE